MIMQLQQRHWGLCLPSRLAEIVNNVEKAIVLMMRDLWQDELLHLSNVDEMLPTRVIRYGCVYYI
jgi:hypothetical protein